MIYFLCNYTMNIETSISIIESYCSLILKSGTRSSMNEEEAAVLLERLYSIKEHIFFIKKNNEGIKRLVPKLILRRMVHTSFNASLHKIIVIEHLIQKKQLIKVPLEGTVSALWAAQACSFLRIRSFILKVESQLSLYRLSKDDIKKGDVILSYKTESFLAKERLSSIIALTTNSPITHSLIATNDSHPHIFLSANPESKGLGLKNETPKKGELYLIMRLRESISPVQKEDLYLRIDHWTQLASQQNWKHFSFAELKSWVACIIGFIYVISSYLFFRPLCLPNPVRKPKTIFCSELIDIIFREVGIYLTPRSENYSVVGPVELFYSPFLELKGVILNEEDLPVLKKEIGEQFTLSFLYNKK